MENVDIPYLEQLFSFVTDEQLDKFNMLPSLYAEWNDKINVISRKDIDNIFTHHILHSLAIAMFCRFSTNTHIVDVGTGGGIVGICLAIMFPQSKFSLIDRTAKKIKVANAIIDKLYLSNVRAMQMDFNEDKTMYDFAVGRGVCSISEFYYLTRKHIIPNKTNSLQNGIIYLTGEDAVEGLKGFKHPYKICDIRDFFYQPFFETKKIVYIPIHN